MLVMVELPRLHRQPRSHCNQERTASGIKTPWKEGECLLAALTLIKLHSGKYKETSVLPPPQKKHHPKKPVLSPKPNQGGNGTPLFKASGSSKNTLNSWGNSQSLQEGGQRICLTQSHIRQHPMLSEKGNSHNAPG